MQVCSADEWQSRDVAFQLNRGLTTFCETGSEACFTCPLTAFCRFESCERCSVAHGETAIVACQFMMSRIVRSMCGLGGGHALLCVLTLCYLARTAVAKEHTDNPVGRHRPRSAPAWGRAQRSAGRRRRRTLLGVECHSCVYWQSRVK